MLERRAVELGEELLGAVEQARAVEVLRELVGRIARRSAGRSGRSSRFWCMRIARSISPWRRNSDPSAKCRSIVCGSTLTTSMNDSIALSGCSFSRKLRPRKYDSGSARDSRSRCLMSMRAAIQPSAKNSAGIGSSHQSSKSISTCFARSPVPMRGRCPARCWSRRRVRSRALLAAALRELALETRGTQRAGQEPGGDAARERDEHHDDQRRFPRRDVEEVEARGLRCSAAKGRRARRRRRRRRSSARTLISGSP